MPVFANPFMDCRPHARPKRRGRIVALATIALALLFLAMGARAQDTEGNGAVDREPQPAPERVEVEPVAADSRIASRLRSILEATGWYRDINVRARDGVVFLDGGAISREKVVWAGDLARRTEGVVAVVNRIEVDTVAAWDLSPAAETIQRTALQALQGAPLLIAALIMLAFAWWLTLLAARGLRTLYNRRLGSRLLADLAAFATAVPILLIALYLVLQISGLTRLALTVIGGTGLAGIILGFAFRDIAENFLASVLLSVRQPFNRDDLIDVAGHTGTVQQLNTRSTILLTADGNHVQIPNATVYKSTIINYSSNPLRRDDFTLGIGYDEPISQAQEIVLGVLDDHPAVASEPESMVLVTRLGPSTVELAAYYWFDGRTYMDIRVKSALVRLSKKALLDAGIELPGERREILFPEGVPIGEGAGEVAARAAAAGDARREKAKAGGRAESGAAATAAEGDLESETEVLRAQTRGVALPEGGGDLLDDRGS